MMFHPKLNPVMNYNIVSLIVIVDIISGECEASVHTFDAFLL
jgi:hypothetical protein